MGAKYPQSGADPVCYRVSAEGLGVNIRRCWGTIRPRAGRLAHRRQFYLSGREAKRVYNIDCGRFLSDRRPNVS